MVNTIVSQFFIFDPGNKSAFWFASHSSISQCLLGLINIPGRDVDIEDAVMSKTKAPFLVEFTF